MDVGSAAHCERQIGRYQIYGALGAGGMATVYFGRLLGDAGFARTVAIKRLHPQYANVPELASMFLDEARVASRIRHPNVVTTLDTISEGDELMLVMEYVLGESLASLQRACSARGERIPLPIAVRICADALYGLEAAHHATDADQKPLEIVHRDVSPQNILVGADGLGRLLDFGIARATSHIHTTREGQLKGKLRYMAPEQMLDEDVTPRTDVYALSVVLWEVLTGKPLFEAGNEGAMLAKILEGVIVSPTRIVPEVPAALSEVVLRGLERDPTKRFESARAMAVALEHAVVPALGREVGEWVRHVASAAIAERSKYIAAIEGSDRSEASVPPRAPVEALATATLTDVSAPVVRATTEPPPRRPTTRIIAAALIACAGIAGTGLVIARGRREPASPQTTDVALASSAPAPSLAPAAASAALDSIPTPAETTPIPAAATSAHRTPKRTTPPSTRSRAQKPGCDPPWYEDPTGIRRVKSGCL